MEIKITLPDDINATYQFTWTVLKNQIVHATYQSLNNNILGNLDMVPGEEHLVFMHR